MVPSTTGSPRPYLPTPSTHGHHHKPFHPSPSYPSTYPSLPTPYLPGWGLPPPSPNPGCLPLTGPRYEIGSRSHSRFGGGTYLRGYLQRPVLPLDFHPMLPCKSPLGESGKMVEVAIWRYSLGCHSPGGESHLIIATRECRGINPLGLRRDRMPSFGKSSFLATFLGWHFPGEASQMAILRGGRDGLASGWWIFVVARKWQSRRWLYSWSERRNMAKNAIGHFMASDFRRAGVDF